MPTSGLTTAPDRPRPVCGRVLSATERFILMTKMKAPAEGWNGDNFTPDARQKLTIALVTVAQLTRAAQGRKFAAFLQRFFAAQLEAILDEVPGAKASIRIVGDEALWQRALSNVLGTAADVQLVNGTLPLYQSTAAQGITKTGALLGNGPPPRGIAEAIAKDARDLATQITGINRTTRNRFEREIRGSIANGDTVTETVRRLRDKMPTIAAARIPTIARTETQRAWDAGTKRAFRLSRTLTHVSVIGCEAREANSPRYRGESTCNIKHVPVADMAKLVFHPNHTGTIVPDKFVPPALAAAPNPREAFEASERVRREREDAEAERRNVAQIPDNLRPAFNQLPPLLRRSRVFPSVTVSPTPAARTAFRAATDGRGGLQLAQDATPNDFYHGVGHWTHHSFAVVTDRVVADDFIVALRASRARIEAIPPAIRGRAYFEARAAAGAAHGVSGAELAATFLAVYDVVGALTRGKEGGGHSVPYYRADNGAAKEVFAHAFAGNLAGNAMLATYFPELTSWMNGFVESL